MTDRPEDTEPAEVDAEIRRGRRLPSPSRLLGIVRGIPRAVISHERVLVRLMALTICLSAFSVWQATWASDNADAVAAEIRATQSQQQVWETTLQTYVDHDVRVLAKYCDFAQERDAALYRMLDVDLADAAAVTPGELGMRSLAPLVLGGVPEEPCAGGGAAPPGAETYSIARAESALKPSPGDVTGMSWQATSLLRQERWLMVAGLLFAISMFGLIGIDALRDRQQRPARLSPRSVRRGQRLSLALATAAFTTGLVIVAKWGRWGPLIGFCVVIALVVTWWWRPQWGPSRSPSRRGLSLRLRHPQWWAEVVGALTLVAFSAAALGLSYVSGQEREARSRSDAESVVSTTRSQQGQVTAMRELDAASEVAVLDARLVAASLRDDFDAADAAAARRDHLESLLNELEASVRAQLSSRPSEDETSGCPAVRPQPDADARALLGQIEDRAAGAVLEHIHALQEGAMACYAASGVTASIAERWSARASAFTIALVLLGLSGFLLALAADPGRTSGMANWLLRIGAFGALSGLVFGMSVPVRVLRDGDILDISEVRTFSGDIAAGKVNGCDVEPFDRAIARAPSYGPAYADRGLARYCRATVPADPGMLTSDVKKDAVSDILADFDRAMRLGPATSAVVGQLGWVNILSGLQGGSQARSQLRLGRHLTLEALARRALARGPAAEAAGVLRFNAALATAALGDWDPAGQDYRRAIQCLDAGSECPGGGLADPERRVSMVLWALADLELMPQTDRVDQLRDTVVGSFNGTAGEGLAWRGASLEVFPQGVRVSGGAGDAPEAAVVWYFRPNDDSSWAVLEDASLKTLQTGQHLGRTIPANQALPTGSYRADVYVGGRKVSSLTDERTSPEGFIRQTETDLAVSMTVPDTWETKTHVAGTDWVMGPPASEGASSDVGAEGVVIHRLEGVEPTDGITTFLNDELEDWLAETQGKWVAAHPDLIERKDFAGFGHTLVRRYKYQPLIAAIGYNPYATSVWCGGALMMATVTGADLDDETMQEVFESIQLDGEPPGLPRLGDSFESDDLRIGIPDGWDAAGLPAGTTGDLFRARECSTGHNLIVSEEPLEDETLKSYVDGTIEQLAVEKDFPGFVLLSRKPVEVEGSQEAVELVFRWRPKKGLVWQRQTYATDGKSILHMTFTANADDPTAVTTSDVFADSVEMRGE